MSKPREFWIWPKNENSFFGEILSNEDYESAINPHCLKLSFKVIEYSAYENINKENEELKKENEIMRDALEFYTNNSTSVWTCDGEHELEMNSERAREALEKVNK